MTDLETTLTGAGRRLGCGCYQMVVAEVAVLSVPCATHRGTRVVTMGPRDPEVPQAVEPYWREDRPLPGSFGDRVVSQDCPDHYVTGAVSATEEGIRGAIEQAVGPGREIKAVGTVSLMGLLGGAPPLPVRHAACGKIHPYGSLCATAIEPKTRAEVGYALPGDKPKIEAPHPPRSIQEAWAQAVAGPVKRNGEAQWDKEPKP